MYDAVAGAPRRPPPAPPQMVTTKDQLNSSRRVATDNMFLNPSAHSTQYRHNLPQEHRHMIDDLNSQRMNSATSGQYEGINSYESSFMH